MPSVFFAQRWSGAGCGEAEDCVSLDIWRGGRKETP